MSRSIFLVNVNVPFWRIAGLCVVPASLVGACASDGGEQGSETHFVTCRASAECPSETPYCVEQRCSKSPALDAGGAGGAEGGDAAADATQPACGALPPALYACVAECGDTRELDLVCSEGKWTCPPAAPFRTDQCPSPECRVSATEPGPYPVRFEFTNASGANLALWEGCQIFHAITACSDGYTSPLSTFSFCTPSCPSDGNCPVCGPCADMISPLATGASTSLSWSGERVEFQDSPPCGCVERPPVMPGRYRIEVPVYDGAVPASIEGGFRPAALYTVSVEFNLPDDDGVVEVAIDDSSYIVPSCSDPDTCLVRFNPEVPEAECRLDPSRSDLCPASAPRAFGCRVAIPLTAGCLEPTSSSLEFTPGGEVVRCCP